MSVQTDVLASKVRDASPDTRRQVAALLDQDAARDAWAEQVGPAYSRAQVADLLDISPQAVAKRTGLLALDQADGRVVYPVCQFDGRHPVAGVDDVVRTLEPAVATAWTTASWLTSPKGDLDGRSPIEALRDGDRDVVQLLAERFARTFSR